MNPDDERYCAKHVGGQHCWHDIYIGMRGVAFLGKYESIHPVQCCHCGRKAKQKRHIADGIDYQANPEAKP